MVAGSDSYLEIAEAVLRRARTPLSTRQIMDLAFLSGVVPTHLHGSTQYKTLGARLSEDILRLKRRSRFFRTKPGRFFLREFISDKTLPVEHRTPIVAARRRRQLRRKNVASIDVSLVSSAPKAIAPITPDQFKAPGNPISPIGSHGGAILPISNLRAACTRDVHAR